MSNCSLLNGPLVLGELVAAVTPQLLPLSKGVGGGAGCCAAVAPGGSAGMEKPGQEGTSPQLDHLPRPSSMRTPKA